MNYKRVLSLVTFIAVLIAAIEGQTSPEYKILFEKAKFTMETKGDLNGAISLFSDIIKNYPKEREYAAKSQFYIGLCYEKLGVAEAKKAYERVVHLYADQSQIVSQARTRLAALGGPVSGETSSGMVVKRVWAGPDVDLEGGVSPDGRYITYIDWSSGDLAIHDLVTGKNRRLTNNPAGSEEYADFAVFSPDGREVAYAWCGKDGYYDLRAVAADGSSQRILYHNRDVPYFLPQSWSKDGRYILCIISKSNSSSIALVSTTDSTLRIVKSIPGWRYPDISLSPDGQWIAYSLDKDENPGLNDIYVISSDGSKEFKLVDHPSNDLWPVWTPDGGKILFVSDRGGTLGFWLISVRDVQAQDQPQLIKPDIGRIRPFGFTSAGTLYYGLTAGTGEVYSVGIDLKNGKLTTDSSPALKSYMGFNGTPDFSPDGEYLACLSLRGYNTGLQPGNKSLVIRSLKNGSERQIPLNFAPGWELKWSPDSRSVLIPGVDIKRAFNLYIVDIVSGIVKPLGISSGFNNSDGSLRGWFPDKKSLFMIRSGPKDGEAKFQVRLVRYSMESKEMQDIFVYKPEDVHLSWITLSPDGKQFAAWKHSPENGPFSLQIIPADGAAPHEFKLDNSAFGQGWEPKGLTWTPDGQNLLFASNTGANEKRGILWEMAVTDGKPVNIGSIPEKVYDVVIHPSGKQVAFSTMQFKFEIWMMENFLPKEKTQPSNQLTLKKLDYPQLSYPYAEISPDGKKIAYYIAGQTKQGIGFLDLVSGTAEVIIESGAGGQASKVWSPRSDKIAYRLNDNEIHIYDINGAKSQLFYKSPEYKLYPTDWSRDGKKIVCFFEAKDRTLRIGTIMADGQVRVLASGNQTEFVSEPKFSPEGNYIAFSRKDEKGNSDIFILASDGSITESVASHPGRDECPVWSPDGKYLLFLSDRNRSADLWGIGINQGKTAGAPFIIKRDLGWRTLVQDLTADGRLFMFTQSGNEPGNLFTILLDKVKGSIDGPITPVSVYPTDHSFPRYSPDGKMIAYLSRRGQIGYPKLFVMDEKGAERELPLQGHYATNIAWHPENNTLFFTGWDKTQKTGVYEVSLAKEEIKLVYSSDMVDMKTGKGRLVNINLIPDAGKMMFFKLLEGGYVEVLTCMPDGLNPAVVIPRVKMPMWGLPSPDGYNICYRSGDSLMVVSVSDGIPRQIGSSTVNLEATWSSNGENLMFREGSSLRVYSVKGKVTRTSYQPPAGKTIGGIEMYANIWSPDGNRVIITEQDTSSTSISPQKLILINPVDGSFNALGEAPKGYRLSELRWSPDGSKVIATGNSISTKQAPAYEYWVLENFLPK